MISVNIPKLESLNTVRKKLESGRLTDLYSLYEHYPALKDMFSKKLTPLDNDTVIKNRISNAETHHEFKRKLGLDTPHTALVNGEEYELIRKNIVKEFFNKALIYPREAKVTLVTGLAGSGKSTFAEQLAKEKNFFYFEGNDIRELLMSFQKTKASHIVHHEKQALAREIVHQISDIKTNFVYPMQGIAINKVKELAQLFKNKGYVVELMLMDVPVEIAFQRTLKRYRETGRFFDPYSTDFFSNAPKRTYNALDPNIDFFTHYDNQASHGLPRILVEKVENPHASTDPLSSSDDV